MSIMSIILYTDYNKLSSDFTATFRKNNQFEPFESVKARNSKYWWWSKCLKEAVAVYGQKKMKWHDYLEKEQLYGPFYCGMSNVMSLPRFSIPLLSPTSTSKQISVALRFSGSHGMLIEMNNYGYKSQWIPGLDVSWISRFKEEDERYMIIIYTICILQIYRHIIYIQIVLW